MTYACAFLLTVAYDGFAFHGWLDSNNLATIEGHFKTVIKTVLKCQTFFLKAASKTDAQVHALDQKVLLKLSFEIKGSVLTNLFNKHLPLAIKVLACQKVPTSFSIPHQKEKNYLYVVNDHQANNVFLSRYYYYLPVTLSLLALQKACLLFIGEHDFWAFSKVAKDSSINTIRTITSITVQRNSHNYLEFHFKGNSFIHSQIRIIVATLIQIALNKITEAEVQTYFVKKQKIPYIVPGYGLFLKKLTLFN